MDCFGRTVAARQMAGQQIPRIVVDHRHCVPSAIARDVDVGDTIPPLSQFVTGNPFGFVRPGKPSLLIKFCRRVAGLSSRAGTVDRDRGGGDREVGGDGQVLGHRPRSSSGPLVLAGHASIHVGTNGIRCLSGRSAPRPTEVSTTARLLEVPDSPALHPFGTGSGRGVTAVFVRSPPGTFCLAESRSLRR